ncbi:MAG: substrate-binding domain-containing protein [Bryobacteraceae bacterium]
MPIEARTQLHEIRQRRGISAARLADLAGISRQTVYAIEAGNYIPNTAVALHLAKLLEVQVEDLFQIEVDPPKPPKPVNIDLIAPGAAKGQPVQLCRVGKRLIGIPATPQPVLPIADGVIVDASRRSLQAEVQLLSEAIEDHKRLLIAGCDPGISLLAHQLGRSHDIDVIVAPSTSRQALDWLKDGKVHVAGTHLRDSSSGEYNLPAIQSLFPDRSVKVVTFAIWEQGLVFQAANPKHIRGVADLALARVRIINREQGAGSRELLDDKLREAGIRPDQVNGYDRVALGHLPAALAVSRGEADCCIATRSAARAFGLSFLPLATERYDLVVRRTFAKLPAVEALLDTLNRSALRRKLELLAGYDTSHTGEILLH